MKMTTERNDMSHNEKVTALLEGLKRHYSELYGDGWTTEYSIGWLASNAVLHPTANIDELIKLGAQKHEGSEP